MNESLDRIFYESYRRIMKNIIDDKTFTDAFYARFIGGNEKIAKLFEHTDFRKQKNMFTVSVMHLVNHYLGRDKVEELQYIGEFHSRFNLNKEDYQYWINCMLDTVSEYDNKYNDEIKRTWEEVLNSSVKYLILEFS